MAVGHPQSNSATIAPLGIACRAGYCCGAEVLQPGRTVYRLSLFAASTAPSDTTLAPSPEGGFHARSSLILSRAYGPHSVLIGKKSSRKWSSTLICLRVDWAQEHSTS